MTNNINSVSRLLVIFFVAATLPFFAVSGNKQNGSNKSDYLPCSRENVKGAEPDFQCYSTTYKLFTKVSSDDHSETWRDESEKLAWTHITKETFDFSEAERICKELEGRLPTNKEYEKAVKENRILEVLGISAKEVWTSNGSKEIRYRGYSFQDAKNFEVDTKFITTNVLSYRSHICCVLEK